MLECQAKCSDCLCLMRLAFTLAASVRGLRSATDRPRFVAVVCRANDSPIASPERCSIDDSSFSHRLIPLASHKYARPRREYFRFLTWLLEPRTSRCYHEVLRTIRFRLWEADETHRAAALARGARVFDPLVRILSDSLSASARSLLPLLSTRQAPLADSRLRTQMID